METTKKHFKPEFFKEESHSGTFVPYFTFSPESVNFIITTFIIMNEPSENFIFRGNQIYSGFGISSFEHFGTPTHQISQTLLCPPGRCRQEIFPIIPFKNSYIYHFCHDFCFGHDFVFIVRNGELKQHHWVGEHRRFRKGKFETVRGHYRLTPR